MSTRIFVADQLANTLPFQEALDWKTLQHFCTDFLKTDSRYADVRDFLEQGAAQDGIDVYAIPRDGSKLTVAQCKLKQYVSPKELHEIVDTFLRGNFAARSKEFILCTSFDFKSARAELAIEEVRAKLRAVRVDFILWDKSGLETELRTRPQPQLIARYFGVDIAQAFYGKTFEDSIAKYQTVSKRHYPRNPNYIERTLTAYGELKARQQLLFLDNERGNTLAELYAPTIEKEGKRIAMLSTAGFGKTWEADALAVHFAEAEQLLLPIKTYLSDYEGQSIETLLHQLQKDWEAIPKEALLLILDGLDDIKSIYVRTFTNYLNQFIESNPTVNIFVSSRFNFYDLAYPPLRNFSVYILDEFTPTDIANYVVRHLPGEVAQFHQRLDAARFSEYASNPYYLTRLVRFYKDKHIAFPLNKAALFERILFEGFEADKHKYHMELDRAAFQSIAEKVAFCLTLSCKNGLDADELEAVIPEMASRAAFQRMFLFTRSVAEKKVWSFEHKNLQEYLCASALQRVPFVRVKSIVSFAHTPDKLQPWFLNTISFLFSGANSSLFDELFGWLYASQPELLVRFEKDRIQKSKRFDILKSILDYYGNRNLSLYGSSNFSVGELADFVEIDEQAIDYLEQKLFAENTGDWLAYDIIALLSACRSPHVYKKQLTRIILSAVPMRSGFNRFAAGCIRALIDLKFFDREITKRLLDSGIDFQIFETRSAMVSYLNHANLTEDYCDFILESREVYAEGQKKITTYGPDELLRKIIIKLKSPANIKKVLRLAIVDPFFISKNYSFRKAHLSHEDAEQLLLNASEAFKSDKSVLPLVYRIFIKDTRMSYDREYSKSFRNFFSTTSGVFCVFQKMYRYDRTGRNLMLLIDEQGSNYLLDEYREGRISDFHMGQFRNRLSYENRDLYLAFQGTLEAEYGNKFVTPDLQVDYAKLRQEYVAKNQQMLLQRDEFFAEADRIFDVIGKHKVSSSDLWSLEKRELVEFEPSLALHALQRRADEVPRDKIELFGNLQNDEQWDWFKVKRIEELLTQGNEPQPLNPQLIDYAKAWCMNFIKETDYTKAVTQNGIGSVFFNERVEFNNKLFALLNMDVDDELLLKMLPSIFLGGLEGGENGLAKLIIEKVYDKDQLKAAVLRNIEQGLPTDVLEVHFSICHCLHYVECIPKLYVAIIGNEFLTSNGRNRLTDYYLDLGGKLQHFKEHLQPAPDVVHYFSWSWHLLELGKDTNPELVTPILSRVLTATDQPVENKILACRLLTQLGDIRALYYWRDYIFAEQKTPFDHNQDEIIQQFQDMPVAEVVPLLLEVLDFTYANNLHETLSFPDSIEDAVYAILYAAAMKDVDSLKVATGALSSLFDRNSGAAFSRHIEFHRERILQDFYKRQNQEISLTAALEAYQKLTSSVATPIEKN